MCIYIYILVSYVGYIMIYHDIPGTNDIIIL